MALSTGVNPKSFENRNIQYGNNKKISHLKWCHSMSTTSATTCFNRHGGVSGSTPGLWSMQVMLETWVRIPCETGSQFKKSQTAMSSTEPYFSLSVVCILVECTKDSVRGLKKNIQKWIEWCGQRFAGNGPNGLSYYYNY